MEAAPAATDGVRISCGHVEANLLPSSINELLELVGLLRLGALQPSHIDGDYAEVG